jgi:hypothetical protein
VCKPGYTLVLSPPQSYCTRNSLLFACLSPTYVSFNGHLCYSNESNALSTLAKCKSTVLHCLLCLYQSTTVCLACDGGYLLQENSCMSACQQGYYQVHQACLKATTECKVTSFHSGYLNTSFNINTVTQSQLYLSYRGSQVLNDPYGY